MIVTPNSKVIYTIVLVLLMVGSSMGQNQVEDSLLTVLNQTKHDSSKLAILLEIAEITNDVDTKKSIEYYKRALQIENDKKGRASIINSLGLSKWKLGEFEEAIGLWTSALQLNEELNDSTALGKIYNNIAVANWGLGYSNEALRYYHKGLTIRKAINDEIGVSKIQNNIGLIYHDWGQYDEALKIHEEALDVAMNTEDFDLIAYSYSNIGNCYESLNEFQVALNNYLKAKELLINNNSRRSLSFVLSRIGSAYTGMLEMDSALVNYQYSLQSAIDINNKNRIAIANYDLSKIYLKLNEVDSAFKYSTASYNQSVEFGYSNQIKDNKFVLAEIAERRGQTALALKYYKSACALKDSLFNKEKAARFTDLQIKYNLDQKLQENILLRRNNKIQELTIRKQKIVRGVLLGSSFLILIILVFILKSRSSLKKLSVKLENSEKQLIELNANKDRFFSIIAHDLKSPFYGLLGMSELLHQKYDQFSQEEVREMIQLINDTSSKIFTLLDSLLQWAQVQSGNMNYTFERINVYPIVNKVIDMFDANAKGKKIDIENRIKNETYLFADQISVETILRNLISNGIKYSNPGDRVVIDSEQKESVLIITVSDNGIGMKKELLNKLFLISEKVTEKGTDDEPGTGLGLILCKELIERNNGSIEVESEWCKGSTFTLTFPKS